jgi:Glucose / Sorbosone dehydrogenase
MRRFRGIPRCGGSGRGILIFGWALALGLAGLRTASAQYPAGPQITRSGTALLIEDYASAPLSSRGGSLSNPSAPIDFMNQLGRLNFLRCEPAHAPLAAARCFVCDLNRNLYLLDRSNRTFTTYINFQAVFPKFDNDPGYAGGLVAFQFDPDYASNGVFYTVHTEDPSIGGTAAPTNTALPGFNTAGYTTTPPVNPPAGSVLRQAVLIEWTDTNIDNDTFEGTARELLRVGFNSNIHPMGDLVFNPLARPGDEDYGNLYIGNGDGAAGETPGATRTTPQRLDAIQGKILRITPDLNLRTNDELSANGRYRIPTSGSDPNPFVSVNLPNLKKEIYAYGFRNCHRLTWDPVSNELIENDIGLNSWEEVNIIHPGGNYGYSEREGTEQLFVGGTNNGLTGSRIDPPVPFPDPDSLIVTGLVSAVTPLYPVANYSHQDGDAISSGFVYRGSLLPSLYGKYVFGDITTGRIFYSDLAEMIADDDGDRNTVAAIHELQLVYGGQDRRMFDIVADAFVLKGGVPPSGRRLPGSAPATSGNDIDGVPYGGGRADIRLAVDKDGELYVLSKSDGMIRRLTAVLVPPRIDSITVTNHSITLTWMSISNRAYRVQFKNALDETNWSDLPGDVLATGAWASKTDLMGDEARFYRLTLP